MQVQAGSRAKGDGKIRAFGGIIQAGGLDIGELGGHKSIPYLAFC